MCKAKTRGKLARVMEKRNMRRDFIVNKYQQQEEEICRKRTTADRQKQGKRIFSISTQQQNYNSPSPVAFINKESGFLTFAVVFGIHNNFVNVFYMLLSVLAHAWYNPCSWYVSWLKRYTDDFFSSIFSNCFLHKFYIPSILLTYPIW